MKPPQTSEKQMIKFKENTTYKMHSPCDQECVWTYKIVKRTAKTITTECGKKLRITPSWDGEVETVSPLGKYSMSPLLTAEKLAN